MNTFRNVLFVPHGAPTFALEPGAAGAAMSDVVQKLSPPRAIVVLSPHWATRTPTVSTATRLETIYDFYGFPEALYSIQYPATGCPEVAKLVATALRTAGFEVLEDSHHGLDHGAWQPLRQMFPDADVPIVPLSMQTHAGPEQAYRIGQALSSLAEQDIWVVASGNITHNLRDWQIISMTGQPSPPYVAQFADWIHAQLGQANTDALLNYRQTQPSASRAHPRDEHLLPLFTALGAAKPQAQARAFYRGIYDHVIAMDGYAFH